MSYDHAHGDMNLSILMVYAQSIEKSKPTRISRNFKRGRSAEQNQSKFKKRSTNHDQPSALNVKVKGGSSSQGFRATCVRCGKKHFGKCLTGFRGCFGCVRMVM